MPTGAEETKKIGKITRKQYEGLKKRALEFEKNNNKAILVIPCDGDAEWCELGDNSALIYKYIICARIGAPTNFSDDSESFYTQFKMGKIRTRGFDTVRNRIKKSGFYKSEIEKDKCIIFKLNKVFDQDEMQHMLYLEDERQKRINNIVKTGTIYPGLYRAICECLSRYRNSILKQMDRETRDTIGKDILENFFNILRCYYKISSIKNEKTLDKLEWNKIIELSNNIIIDLQIFSEQESKCRDVCAEVGLKLESIIGKAQHHL